MAEYRLAPAVVLRSAGAAFVLLAVAVLALSVVTALAGWSFLVVGVVAGLGLLGVVGGAWWAANRAYVVRLDSLGYEVRLVRGAGVKRARWADVAQASTAEVARAAVRRPGPARRTDHHGAGRGAGGRPRRVRDPGPLAAARLTGPADPA